MIFNRVLFPAPLCPIMPILSPLSILKDISFNAKTLSETEVNGIKWYPCHSGGEFRKWYGNHSIIVNWQNNGEAIRKFGFEKGRIRSAVRNQDFYFKDGLTWSKISSGKFAARWRPSGFLFDDTGRCGFADSQTIQLTLGLFCSKLTLMASSSKAFLKSNVQLATSSTPTTNVCLLFLVYLNIKSKK